MNKASAEEKAIYLRSFVATFSTGLVAALMASHAAKVDYYPAQQTWQPSNTGSENVSLFIFRDRDSDGVYSFDDPPVANAAVVFQRPDGSRLIRRSNLYGFVNITNSATIPGVDIDQEAAYTFEVVPPPGWRVTTDNGTQAATFRHAP